ncbi:apoptosis regulator BAX-like [Polymixia lowei]
MEFDGTSDERIGESLIKEVFQEELKEVSLEQVPPFAPVINEVQNEDERKILKQLGIMVRIVGDAVKQDQAFQDAIDAMPCSTSSSSNNFSELVNIVFEDGLITWERIAVLFYIAGKLAKRMVLALIPQSVMDIFKWTVNYFRSTLLRWVCDHGGWISSFSDLARVPMQNMSSMSSRPFCLFIIFVTGLTLGSFITWKFVRRT